MAVDIQLDQTSLGEENSGCVTAYHGGDPEGDGCGVRLGITCSPASSAGVELAGGVGVLYLGCLIFGGGADGGAF
jgi:hypothetical protein